ncbi:2-hydroxyacid dehydrogenase [Methylobacterium planeticum]|uniref:Glyoxylate/hydroxypyruvate reductase A n=1 Tax=Methylobacterium planeticum TaxID=2615211 RepID=A0A6N6MM11_9HYPH|nr:glyoxylate/hydroxypyruvate reductase A [Methylobacterium planeticum]KAB1070277.1 glyoxylate/hydroxypyruvate reductase A [Methylobacterium planeticum]
MTTSPIPLVTRGDAASEEEWQAVLAAAMPDETILPFRTLTAEQRGRADIAIVANPDPADVAALPNLAWVQSLWAGVERLVGELGAGAPPIVRLIDLELSRVMAEAVLAWTYYLHRGMPDYARQQRGRIWQALPYRPPSQVQVGLLGLGALGATAAERLIRAGFAVAGWSRSGQPVAGIEAFTGADGLSRLLARSDIVVCLLPLTAETRGLLDAARLAAMKSGAALINFARGPIVVKTDLIAALNSGHLAHAVLDVFDIEPLPPDAPEWDHPKVTVLPHISAPTDRRSAAAIVAGNVRRYRRNGELPDTVDRMSGY